MIPVNRPFLFGNEKNYLAECIDTQWVSSEGPFIENFEKKMASLVNRDYGIAVSSGTAALEIALKTMQLNPGDEVIMPTFTIISCVSAVLNVQAKPVLVDCSKGSFNMDVSQIEKKITSKTKAILVVHIYGLPVDIDPVLRLASEYGLKVIEDAAEMHGQYYKNRPCGSFGDISIFSFYANKLITTGEGGMILTNNVSLAERARFLRNLCFIPGQRFIHYELGHNYRMTNLQAAVGVAQLERLSELVDIKRRIGGLYNELLANCSNLYLPISRETYAENIYWVYPIVLQSKAEMTAEELAKKLSICGIQTRPFFWPMHMQPVLKKINLFHGETYPNSEYISKFGLYLPSGLGTTEEEINIVCNALEQILNE